MILFAILLTVLFCAIVIHEVAHGWIAYKLGDPTAKFAGRITLNPLAHIDPVGTILLPLSLIAISIITNTSPVIFGWAKPVPISFRNLKQPKTDMILVGLAGPAANFTLAMLASVIFKTITSASPIALILLDNIITINLILGVFNLLPIPPLDGSRIIMGILPRKLSYAYASFERYGMLILFLLLGLGVFHAVILPIVQMLRYMLLH